tara:strand:- start:214 stop:423 length:210 start_codon:yes stop_codon:yes gene_type:complete
MLTLETKSYTDDERSGFLTTVVDDVSGVETAHYGKTEKAAISAAKTHHENVTATTKQVVADAASIVVPT